MILLIITVVSSGFTFLGAGDSVQGLVPLLGLSECLRPLQSLLPSLPLGSLGHLAWHGSAFQPFPTRGAAVRLKNIGTAGECEP